MLSTDQLQKIWLLSDTVLYPEAVSFMRRHVQVEGNDPLPISQVNGLLSITGAGKYEVLYRFVLHQRDRNWPPSKASIKKFYTALERFLVDVQRRQLNELRLLTGRSDIRESQQEVDELMALLAREFIHHLAAENMLLAVEKAEERIKASASRRQVRT